MNRIKYINPKTGKKLTQKCSQRGWVNTQRWFPHKAQPRHGTMAEVDRAMFAAGFVRAGIRGQK